MRDELIELIGDALVWDVMTIDEAAHKIADRLIASGVGFIPYSPAVKIYKSWLERYDDALTLRVDFKINDAMHHARLEIADEELRKFGYVRMSADAPDANVGK